MRKVLIPSNWATDNVVLTIAISLINGLTGNTFFPTLTPGLAALTAAQDAYIAALGKAKFGSREERAVKNQCKEDLVQIMRGLAAQINFIANGNVVMLASAGLSLDKEPQPKVLGTATPMAEYGSNAGQIVLFTPAVAGAVSYMHQYTDDPAAAKWNDEPTTAATCIIRNLQPGKVYHMRIVTIGTSNQITTSEVITKMAV